MTNDEPDQKGKRRIARGSLGLAIEELAGAPPADAREARRRGAGPEESWDTRRVTAVAAGSVPGMRLAGAGDDLDEAGVDAAAGADELDDEDEADGDDMDDAEVSEAAAGEADVVATDGDVPAVSRKIRRRRRLFRSDAQSTARLGKETAPAFFQAILQLARSPFEIVDTSLKEAAPMKTWEDKARAAVKRSDLVLVMVGQNTYRAPGVLKEVKMAREEGKPIVQIIGYKDGNYTAVPDAGRLYSWDWDNLKKLLR